MPKAKAVVDWPLPTVPITHEELRRRAIKWLTTTKHMGVVLSEMVTIGCQEIPDVIGFQHHQSTVIECKASRADFLANADKPHMRAGTGVGEYRYFLTPRGLLKPEELPDGWGLLSISHPKTGNVLVEKGSARNQFANILAERSMLTSALRRVRAREFLILVQEEEHDARPVTA